ncbi:hypothetical protein [Daejeonella sp.]|uniref:hypothetical protein n=1 Tax=Daejeonella sp. TaxID=2805397 RepID=UPI0030C51D10
MKHFLLVILLSLNGFAILQASKTHDIALRKNQKFPADSIKITRVRADQLLAKLPSTDPWDLRPDGSALAWGEAATMETLADLYEATGDITYLKQIAFRGDRLLTHRDDHSRVKDGSGHSRPAWSMGLKYVVASGALLDKADKPVISIRSTPSSNNNLTIIELIRSSDRPDRFSLKLSNSFFKRDEFFADLSMNPADERFIEKIVNDPLSPYSSKAGSYTDKSNLIRVKVEMKEIPPSQNVSLTPIPLAYMGYIGIVYHPMLRMAEFVKSDPKLLELKPVAERFIKAAEESYADANRRLWREGPNAGEGYYLTCEKGESFPADNVGQPINFLGMHTSSQLALYRLTGKKDYRDRSEKMSLLLKNRLKYDKGSDLYVWTYWYEPMTTIGWTPADKLSSNVMVYKGSPNIEDSSHGVLDIAMVVAANREGIIFTKQDVQRFANTLLHNVILPERNGIRRAVDGVGGEHPAYFPILHGWLELAATNPEVYHAIRKTYLNKNEENLAFTAELLRWEKKIK